MRTCFVIQPFDGGPFDKRYQDTIRPAIKSCELEAYRVDEDLSVSIPIDEIEHGIRESALCLADITSDNPNVWFELGFAIACRKEVVLICSHERSSKFPFDVQHRNIIQYRTDSRRDLDDLATKISERIAAILRKEQKIGKVHTPLAEVSGLTPHETVALVSLAENIEDPTEAAGHHTIRSDMERAGFNRIATFIALQALVRKKLVQSHEATDFNGNPFVVFQLTQQGTEWLMDNQDRLALKNDADQEPSSIPDEDIPF